MKRTGKLFSLLFLLLSLSIYCQVKLPKLISDGMVLQRETSVKIWGWAGKHETVTIRFIKNVYKAVADENGNWQVTLPKLKAGGPYEMAIQASNNITLKNVYVGDVWICSGQSNMELPISRVSPLYPDEITNSTNECIRQFLVPQCYDFNKPHDDFISGSWKAANPQNVLDFTAAGYFFAKELYDRYKVPIGLINNALGGSPAEAWLSEEALKEFPHYLAEANKFKDSSLIHQIESQDSKRNQDWYALMNKCDAGYKDAKPWYDTSVGTTGWLTMKVPGYWADAKLGPLNGVLWFKKTFSVPQSFTGKSAMLILGRIVDADSVFVNGKFVGTTSYQYPPRRYAIPESLLKDGENTITIRLLSNSGKGGFVPDKHYEIVSGKDTLDLRGDWYYKLGAKMDPLGGQTFIRWKPLGLYNAMIAPLLNYKMKGVIWYQGESNANRPVEYRKLFPALIRNWREKWNEGNFPFIFVQLSNFMEKREQPSESGWALLREAQMKTLSVPNTAMAVISDIGEWNDIHPLNKKDVGKRLALGAMKLAYGEKKIVHSGPLYSSMIIKGNQITLTFTNVGPGLVAKGDSVLNQFAIAGADKNFVWADAKIVGNKVIVSSSKVQAPVAVRYAWADNPEGANLYNKEGLPASPFRTDDFGK